MSELFYWLENLMRFATILLFLKLYVCRVPYSYIAPDLFYYLDWSCLLEAAFGDLILSLINRSMKLIGKKKILSLLQVKISKFV